MDSTKFFLLTCVIGITIIFLISLSDMPVSGRMAGPLVPTRPPGINPAPQPPVRPTLEPRGGVNVRPTK